MKLPYLALVAGTALLCSCASIEDYRSVPKEERAAFLQAKTTEWLRNNIDLVRQGLILTGSELMDRVVKPEDRQEIAAQMYTLSKCFHSCATGQIMSAQELAATIKSFNPNAKTEQVTRFMNEINMVWSFIYSKIKLSGDGQLAKDYLCMFADAAQQVASLYLPQE